MFYARKKKSGLWRKSTNQNSTNLTLDDVFNIEDLKTATKRVSIMSRMEQKNLKNKISKTNKSNSFLRSNTSSKQAKRPQTAENDKFHSINYVEKAYKKEKKMNDKVMSEKYGSEQKEIANIKEGLLGQYRRYQQMGKEELIEKLISLEYLANTIFKKNKYLEQKVKDLDPTYSGIQ